ncbi:MAG: nitroreductase family deazaflavin-dependent oxidoreductase [Gammaproteobacteria bacterium]|nr:nitroreductase family deazaflavin-dependent oxidoreductase [Gammaproteobacteria bacterium]
MDLEQMNKAVVEEFRDNGGKVGGNFANIPILLLTASGAKSGLRRTKPLAYLADGQRYLIIASFAGAPNNPPWYHNLLADPEAEIEVGTERFKVKPEVLGEPERTHAFTRVVAAMPVFADYERKTSRVIPVVALSRR